jgi:hypothetical protein
VDYCCHPSGSFGGLAEKRLTSTAAEPACRQSHDRAVRRCPGGLFIVPAFIAKKAPGDAGA